MAQPAFKHLSDPADAHAARGSTGVRFESGDGAVQAMQAMIYQRFATLDAQGGAFATAADRDTGLDTAIMFVSRWAGISLFFAAVAGIALAVI